ncbi:hypothetical protein CHS0354_041970 [Potamilus streckersoni]|uniref:Uncharacterized protein n=1 Tax=Potamilus streckersoni TaxID=2493646 RepID=A0AAE0T9M4_9BIVA|nr:hypothetical protein CHS0354_041970 [Potamilus streckersoni]
MSYLCCDFDDGGTNYENNRPGQRYLVIYFPPVCRGFHDLQEPCRESQQTVLHPDGKEAIPLLVEPPQPDAKEAILLLVEPPHPDGKEAIPLLVEPPHPNAEEAIPLLVDPPYPDDKEAIPLLVEPPHPDDKEAIPLLHSKEKSNFGCPN